MISTNDNYAKLQNLFDLHCRLYDFLLKKVRCYGTSNKCDSAHLSGKLTKNGRWESFLFRQAPFCPQFREKWAKSYFSDCQRATKQPTFLCLGNARFFSPERRFDAMISLIPSDEISEMRRWNKRDDSVRNAFWQAGLPFLWFSLQFCTLDWKFRTTVVCQLI